MDTVLDNTGGPRLSLGVLEQLLEQLSQIQWQTQSAAAGDSSKEYECQPFLTQRVM